MYQLLAYLFYLSVSSFITIYVGWKCYTYGFVYLNFLIKDSSICKAINKMLLCGYYLLNIGYIAWSLHSWEKAGSISEVLSMVSYKVGTITLILCVLHYINMITIYLLGKKNILHA